MTSSDPTPTAFTDESSVPSNDAPSGSLSLLIRGGIAVIPVVIVGASLAIVSGGSTLMRVAVVMLAVAATAGLARHLVRPSITTIKTSSTALEVALTGDLTTPITISGTESSVETRQLATITTAATHAIHQMRNAHERAEAGARQTVVASAGSQRADELLSTTTVVFDTVIAGPLAVDTARSALQLEHLAAMTRQQVRRVRLASVTPELDTSPSSAHAWPLDDIIRAAVGACSEYWRVDIGPIEPVTVRTPKSSQLVTVLAGLLDAALADSSAAERVYIGTDLSAETPSGLTAWSLLVVGGSPNSSSQHLDEVVGEHGLAACYAHDTNLHVDVTHSDDARFVSLSLADTDCGVANDDPTDPTKIIAASLARRMHEVRPHVMTGGRVEPVRAIAPNDQLAVSTRCEPIDSFRWEAAAIIAAAQQPTTLAELVTTTGVPLLVAQIIAADLATSGSLIVREHSTAPVRTSLLEAALST